VGLESRLRGEVEAFMEDLTMTRKRKQDDESYEEPSRSEASKWKLKLGDLTSVSRLQRWYLMMTHSDFGKVWLPQPIFSYSGVERN